MCPSDAASKRSTRTVSQMPISVDASRCARAATDAPSTSPAAAARSSAEPRSARSRSRWLRAIGRTRSSRAAPFGTSARVPLEQLLEHFKLKLDFATAAVAHDRSEHDRPQSLGC